MVHEIGTLLAVLQMDRPKMFLLVKNAHIVKFELGSLIQQASVIFNNIRIVSIPLARYSEPRMVFLLWKRLIQISVI